MVYNESVFLPMWLAHYGGQVGRENVFVVDVGSNDGSTSGLGANCVRLPRAYLDEERRTSFVHHFHASLLSYYDIVIFCDADEFLVADPAVYPDLIALLEDRRENVLAGIGLNVVQVLDQEPSLDPEVKILAQRHYAQFDSLYCKPLIARTAVPWTPGFHSSSDRFDLCTSLYLFHLKAVDKEIFFSEFEIKKKAGLSAEAVAKGHGVQLGKSAQELMSIYFPVHAYNLSRFLRDDFTFRDDLQGYVNTGFRGLGQSTGSVGVVPERFHDSLPAIRGS